MNNFEANQGLIAFCNQNYPKSQAIEGDLHVMPALHTLAISNLPESREFAVNRLLELAQKQFQNVGVIAAAVEGIIRAGQKQSIPSSVVKDLQMYNGLNGLDFSALLE